MHARLEAGLRGERIIGGKPAVMVLVMRVKLFGRDIVEVAPRAWSLTRICAAEMGWRL